jgi:RHS repeat-associated protein
MPTTTKYIWDEDNYLAEADGSDTINVVYNNEPQQYGNLVSARISNTTSYHHFDAIGSTRQLTNAAGHLTDKVIYDAWGNVVSRTGTTGVAMLWIGELEYYFDSEIATFYVRRRPYVAAIGRWTSVDPAGFVHGSN